ncbi:MAG TPA: choice-of-anchor tandem repeat GloVer-containing protein [Rhizomicrobium sp.]|nr:choice-of-anchor tandem repeat GloVer-containing protein [Rhizomicrobium sp.]
MSEKIGFRAWSQTAAPFAIAAALMAGLASSAVAKGASYDVLYSFTDGTDGGSPYSGLVADKTGNLYGTTGYGGTDGLGVVFELTPASSETSCIVSAAARREAFRLPG